MQDQRPDSWHRWRLYGGWLVLWIALILVGLFVLLSVLIPWAMTGYVPAASGLGSKTLWDWMQLLLVPVVLAIGVSWFQHREKVYELEAGERQRRNEQYIADKKAEVDRAIADDYQQEALLSAYLDHMSDLLLNHHLRDSDIEPERGKDGYIYFPQMPEVQAVARARTLTNLRRLSNDRKVVVLSFLIDAELIQLETPVVSLYQADLSNLDLRQSDLFEAVLSEVDFRGANLSNVRLDQAHLHQVNFKDADLSGALLRNTQLAGANFTNAKLCGANLSKANLSAADFANADLTNAILDEATLYKTKITDEQLKQAKSARGISYDRPKAN